VLQDDDLSLFSPGDLSRYMRTLRWLGIDTLRVSAEWRREVADPDARQPPPGFLVDRPASYTAPGMQLLDRAVRAAASSGLQVMIDPAFGVPAWATRARRASNTDIDPDLVARWEEMLARRYSGDYVPRGEQQPLPRAAMFTLWNEPNNYAYLKPQWRDGVAVSADWYRRLVSLAYPLVKQASPTASVLIGNTSEVGVDHGSVRDGASPGRRLCPPSLRAVCATLDPVGRRASGFGP
jgi:hypothetical protein